MIDLINTLVHKQNCLVVWRNQNSSEGALPKRHGASLYFESCIDTGFDLCARGSFAIGEQMRCKLARRGGCESGFC